MSAQKILTILVFAQSVYAVILLGPLAEPGDKHHTAESASQTDHEVSANLRLEALRQVTDIVIDTLNDELKKAIKTANFFKAKDDLRTIVDRVVALRAEIWARITITDQLRIDIQCQINTLEDELFHNIRNFRQVMEIYDPAIDLTDQLREIFIGKEDLLNMILEVMHLSPGSQNSHQ